MPSRKATTKNISIKDTGPVGAYALAVRDGKILAGPGVRAACLRHLRDCAEGPSRGLHWDVAAADRVLGFFPDVLRLAEGEHAGKPFELQLWQKFIIGSLFGWKGEDGYRRFRSAYIESAKGSGKSPLAAGIGLYMLTADKEASAEVYAAAVTRDQAKILFRDAVGMVEAAPALNSRIQPSGQRDVFNLAHLSSGSYFRPVSSEGRGLDGKRVHCALVDEVHEHPTSVVVDKMRAGTKGRRQALIVEITNSGYDRNSVCWHHHDYSLKVAEGIVDNDSWFGFVCGLDDGDDWQDERVWAKANPNIGISITRKYLAEQVLEAQGMPSKANIVRRLNFCEWTEQATAWLPPDAWDDCGKEPVDAETLLGRECFAGLDLSSTTDVSALVLLFPESGGGYTAVPYFWVPEEGIAKRSDRDRVPYGQWRDQGLIAATPGNVVDYDAIRLKIRILAERYNIRGIAIDRWNSTGLQTQLMGDGMNVVQFGQGFASMTAPCKELEKLILERSLQHGGNPVLRWMSRNVVVNQDPAGNIKPAKDKSAERIDGIVALVMALGMAIVTNASPYAERGLLVF